MDSDFLEKYINSHSPSCYEVEGQKVWSDYMKQYSDVSFTDHYGTSVATINNHKRFKIVLEAHADEIGWNVNYIDDNGFIYVNRNGGSDNTCAMGKEVLIFSEDGGKYRGIFGQTAIHMRNRDSEKAPKVEELFIDIGCKTKAEVHDLNIHIGCKIIYNNKFHELKKGNIVGRALDNRIGGYMISQVAKKIYESKPDLEFSVSFVNSVQEEVGLHGAKMIANRLKPDIAIVTDVCHDTSTPGIDKRKHGNTKIGEGPVIANAPSIHNGLRNYIMQTAKYNKIDFQRVSSSSHSGTDTDEFAFNNGGTPSALIKIPLRYMHTPTEMAHIGDVTKAINLMYEVIVNFDVSKYRLP